MSTLEIPIFFFFAARLPINENSQQDQLWQSKIALFGHYAGTTFC